jgi:lipopolysaccharide export system permease protein
MGSIGRYVFRTTFGAFLMVLVTLTALMWITQALRDIDLVTNLGQGLLAFLGVTGLIIPLLVMTIAPIAFMLAMAYVLNKLSADSELIVMNAAGMPPWHLFRPFLAVGLVVFVLVAAMAAYVSPWSMRELNIKIVEVRTDIIANIVQPGRFTPLEGGNLILHIRERLPNGDLLGIFIDDQRSPKERVTLIAEQGNILKNDRGTFLLLANGSVQRQQLDERDPSIVQFDGYAFDLSQLTPDTSRPQRRSARERYLWELLMEEPDDATSADRAEQVRAELHDRVTAPFYPLATAVLMFAYLGAPRTTRQGRTLSLISALGAFTTLRGLGFVGILAGVHLPATLLIPYIAMAAVAAFGYWAISRGAVIEPPAFIVDAVTAFLERVAERTARLPGEAR